MSNDLHFCEFLLKVVDMGIKKKCYVIKYVLKIICMDVC